MSELLAIEALEFTWPGDGHPVLDLPGFGLDRNEKVFLYGPSGSGKSTLLALIAGLIRPDRGSVRFLDQPLERLSGPARDRFRAEHLGVIFQQFNLLPWLDVRANVALPCRFSRARAQRAGDVEGATTELLEAMGIGSEMWQRRADRLSVGQQQRVAAARALIGRPDLVLADEPTSALDAERRDEFLDLLFDQAAAAGSALLFVSHDRQLAARFDRRISLPELNRAGEVA